MNGPALEHAHAPSTFIGAGAIAMWSFSGLCYAIGGRALGVMPFLCVSSALAVVTIVLLHAFCRWPMRPLFVLPARVALAGVMGIVVYSLLLGSAMGLAPKRAQAQVMLLNYLWPIWIVLLSVVLLRQRVRAWPAVLGALLGFVGVVVAHASQIGSDSGASLLPQAMAAVGSVLWAVYSVLLRRWRIPAEQGGSTFQFLLLSIVAGIIAITGDQWTPPSQWGAAGIVITIFGGIGPFGLAYYGWEIGMKRGAVHVLAVMSYFIPIVSAGLIALYFNQLHDPLLLPGAAMIAGGAWISQRGSRAQSRTETG